ncbi:MAG TPA: hypothetical protein VM680_17760 [Verrucomicrobiae bacterium]|nr:hypothetical protein [Verrucomicrobiae bacterium]
MTPQQKLATAGAMYLAAREFKAVALRSFHPDWSEQKIGEEVTRIFEAAKVPEVEILRRIVARTHPRD